jgi:hypothetical protein
MSHDSDDSSYADQIISNNFVLGNLSLTSLGFQQNKPTGIKSKTDECFDNSLLYLEALNQFDRLPSVKIFGLYVTEGVLKKRLELRSNGEFRDLEICKKLNDDVLKIKHDSEHQIDTTELLPTQTAEKIYKKSSK